MYAFRSKRLRMMATTGAALAGVALLAGCSTDDADGDDTGSEDTEETTETGGDEGGTGDTVVIGFSGPAADHGWLGAINSAAIAEAESYDDVDLRIAEGTNDANLQISQVETFVNEGVDVIVLLPTDGAALTEAAINAMNAGVPVVNVDREFSSTDAARVTILGDNYGMGVSAGEYMCERLGDQPDAIIGEIAGIDSLQLTTDRSQGFSDALAECGLSVSARVAAEFTIDSGQEVTAQLLSANPEFDAIWNHDDDQGIGVLAAIDEAGRDEFFMVGGAGSANAMREIASGESVLEATVIYPSTQAADGIALARLLGLNQGMGDLVSPGVPHRIVLDAPVVTAENVDEFMDIGFES
ncbi:substrate-binding domain-containing protein [Demequina activiva]|uniref:Sugar ABC transporter substrate-binding protein n=1 Tax=Demequina activiva TaxID=1582364 RepID=A0A919Q803_9MICO|nr:substrate-binding domain-containing protein [Demequina activiva]GIG55460.1 sugar ABC transporter substrate-binding protein [Demequina activiva]